MLLEIIRNTILNFFPPKFSFAINVLKNIKIRYLEHEMPVIVKILKEIRLSDDNPICIDVGANLGLYSYLFSCNSCNVIAIEPQPKLANYLRKVLPANVTIINVALSDHSGTTKMFIPKLRGIVGASAQQDALATIEVSNPVISQEYIDSIQVSTKTLDEILHDQHQIDFIKIDVEGHELSVLNGAKVTLAKFRPIFMIELFKAHNPHVMKCFKVFIDAGFTSFYCTNSGITECITLDDASLIIDNPVLEDRTVTNFFFIPSEKRKLILKLI